MALETQSPENLNLASSWWKSPRGFASCIKTLGVLEPLLSWLHRQERGLGEQHLAGAGHPQPRAQDTVPRRITQKKRGTRRRVVILFGTAAAAAELLRAVWMRQSGLNAFGHRMCLFLDYLDFSVRQRALVCFGRLAWGERVMTEARQQSKLLRAPRKSQRWTFILCREETHCWITRWMHNDWS